MYKKGDAKLMLNLSALSEEEQERHWDNCDYSDDHVNAGGDIPQVVVLPHSCGEWIIGGPAELNQLIEDLKMIRIGAMEAPTEEDREEALHEELLDQLRTQFGIHDAMDFYRWLDQMKADWEGEIRRLRATKPPDRVLPEE